MFAASPELAKRDIFCYDQDGHGLSPFSGRADGVAAYVADLKDVLDALGVRKAVLVAHSMNAVSIARAGVLPARGAAAGSTGAMGHHLTRGAEYDPS